MNTFINKEWNIILICIIQNINNINISTPFSSLKIWSTNSIQILAGVEGMGRIYCSPFRVGQYFEILIKTKTYNSIIPSQSTLEKLLAGQYFSEEQILQLLNIRLYRVLEWEYSSEYSKN